MGFLSGLFGIGKKIVSGARTFLENAKAGKQAIQAGFTIKGGADTDRSKAENSIWKTVPVYVWGLAIAVVLTVLVLLGFRKR